MGLTFTSLLRSLWRERRGGTAIIFAVSVPILAVLACAAVDLSSLSSDRSQMQDAADAAALAAARQLGISTQVGIEARARAFAVSALPAVSERMPLTVTTTIAQDNSQLTVSIDGHRASFFANMLPPGGWSVHVQSTAATLGRVPLCVLASATEPGAQISMMNTSIMSAPGCLVQSNGEIAVMGSSALRASVVQSVGGATGAITPQPQVGAPPIPDPFSSLTISPPDPFCLPTNIIYNVGVNVILPGTHCGSINVRNGATVYLMPGEHYFMKGTLELQNHSTLTGSDVVMIFDSHSTFQFKNSSTINLSGRTSGPFAGFVVATTRDNVGTFGISSDSARRLLGTIYIPEATLAVTGFGNRVADQSAWTVVVAKAIQLTGSPNLVINSSYSGSTVPTPGGVGPTGDNRVTLKN